MEDTEPRSGEIADTPLPELFRALYRERRSGVLDLQYADEQRQVFFVNGEVKSAISNEMGHRVGQHLKELGLIEESDIEAALARRSDGLRVGPALVAMGRVDQESLDQELRKLVTSIIYSTFAWPGGQYRFSPTDAPVAADVMLTISTADVILESIRRLTDERRILSGIGDTKVAIEFSPDPALRLQHVTLSPDEGFIVSRIDGHVSIEQLLKLTPTPKIKVLQLVYGLIATGILEPPAPPATESSTRRKATVRAAGKPARQGAQAAYHDAVRDVAQGSTARRQSLNVRIKTQRTSAKLARPEPARSADVEKEELEFRRKKIQTTYRKLSSLSADELLEVAPNATFREIRYNYNLLAEIYHPDVAFRSEYADLKPQLVKIFRRLEASYQRMSSPRSESSFD